MTDNAQGQQPIELTIERMAHGGKGIAIGDDGRVVFVAGAYPGDRVAAAITKTKKSLAFADVNRVVSPGPYRGEGTCPAAAQGAGCCDFHDVVPERELELKISVLEDQLRRIAKLKQYPAIEAVELAPHQGWRTRVRLGVDDQGRAGLRMRESHMLVTDAVCVQLAAGLVEGLVGEGARRFTPNAEVIAVLDSTGTRHVVETRRAPRGRRVETIREVIEGSGEVTEIVDGREYRFPATAFWQAHAAAPTGYSCIVKRLLAGGAGDGWDLYGGVGLFVPAIAEACGGRVCSVDYSAAATAGQQTCLMEFQLDVRSAKVEDVISQLPKPAVVVADPPRTGAGKEVVSAIAAAGPERVVHIGCDPATFARDAAAWQAEGYVMDQLLAVNAFPGTHHFETIARFVPGSLLETGADRVR